MIQINYRDARPIYQQIKDNFRQLIINGAFDPNTKLPSVRELAASLAINPNTIQRAYRELEQEGFIYSISGKGSFVSEVIPIDQKRAQALWQTFEETLAELRYAGVSLQECVDRVTHLFGKEDNK